MNFLKVEHFYSDLYTTGSSIGDDSDDIKSPPDELLQQVHNFLIPLNPPPDTLMKLRATAFKVASQFLQQHDDNNNSNSNSPQIRLLLRQIHGIVKTIHSTYYISSCNNNNLTTDESFDNEEDIRSFWNQLLDEMKLDAEENESLLSFLRSQPPTTASAERLLAFVFTIGHEHLQDRNNNHNEQVFRCMNVMVHAIETVFYQPKPYRLQLSSSTTASSTSSYSAMAATTSGMSREDGSGRGGGGNGEDATTASASSIAYKHNYTKNSKVDLKSMTLNDAAQQLWNYDANRLIMNDDLQLNVQNGKKPYMKEDAATDPLFTHVDNDVFRRSTYAAFLHLLDNYHSKTGVAEQITSTEREEIKHFLSIIMETAPMQFCYQYCKANNMISNHHDDNNNNNDDDDGGSIQEFKELLYSIWFEPYSRDGNERDSSGFEHVFIGEIQDNAISGFHNWIQFYNQEQKGNIDYRGYIKPRGKNVVAGSNDQSDDHLLTLQFAWKNCDSDTYVEKFVGTMFIGVSPEFEMALYTMCFLFGKEENMLTLDTGVDIYELVIKCYTIARGKIGTTFPEVISHYEENDD